MSTRKGKLTGYERQQQQLLRKRIRHVIMRLAAVAAVLTAVYFMFTWLLSHLNKQFGACLNSYSQPTYVKHECVDYGSPDPIEWVMAGIGTVIGVVIIIGMVTTAILVYDYVVKGKPCKGCSCPNHRKDDQRQRLSTTAATALAIGLIIGLNN